MADRKRSDYAKNKEAEDYNDDVDDDDDDDEVENSKISLSPFLVVWFCGSSRQQSTTVR